MMSAHDHLNPKQFRTLGDGASRITVLSVDGDEKGYVRHTEHPDGSLEVNWLESHEQGKGYGTALMEHLYQTRPEMDIDWGDLVHPVSEHLYGKFEDKYPHRTRFSGVSVSNMYDEDEEH